MGNCISSASKEERSDMRFNWSVSSKPESILVKSPIKEATVEFDPSSPVRSFKELSGTDEMFFDSQPWLDSDCEDYFSVYDDTTPSYGNTPVHPSTFTKHSKLDNPLCVEAAVDPVSAYPAAIEVKKQLFELFNESFRVVHVETEAKCSVVELPTESSVKITYNTNSAKVKSSASPRCCLPNLVRSLSFGEKRRR